MFLALSRPRSLPFPPKAVRNNDDLSCLSCPPKYRSMKDFHGYFTGEKKAPVFIFLLSSLSRILFSFYFIHFCLNIRFQRSSLEETTKRPTTWENCTLFFFHYCFFSMPWCLSLAFPQTLFSFFHRLLLFIPLFLSLLCSLSSPLLSIISVRFFRPYFIAITVDSSLPTFTFWDTPESSASALLESPESRGFMLQETIIWVFFSLLHRLLSFVFPLFVFLFDRSYLSLSFSVLLSGHFEQPPYTPNTLRSAYHVRSYEIWKLSLVMTRFKVFFNTIHRFNFVKLLSPSRSVIL